MSMSSLAVQRTTAVYASVTVHPVGSNASRCGCCGSPLVDAPAYPRPGRKLVCMASRVPRPLGATLLQCGAPRWEDRAA